jgi:hypothetical protein
VADDDDDEALRLVTETFAAMLPGQTGWVSGMWTAKTGVCDVQVTATGRGASIDYPENTKRFSSFSKSADLAKDALDYTAFLVTVGDSQSSSVTLTLRASYVVPDEDSKPGECDGRRQSMTQTATLPVTSASGAAVTLTTTTATIKAGQATWVPLTFAGTKPDLEKFQVTVTPPSGITVIYPGEAKASGLSRDSKLAVAGEDYAAVRLDATAAKPGTYTMPVKAVWTGNGSWTGTVSVVVQ